VLLVGLTGGIGSGKSTVADLLARRGAVVIDADDLARRAVDPGTPGLAMVVERFGQQVLTPDGALDRQALARIAFDDDAARRDLEAIVHPEVARLFADAVEPHRSTDRVVVYSVPLLVESHLDRAFDMIVTVSAAEETRVARLGRDRGMTEDDVRGRMRAQATDDRREAVADLVIRNDGSLDDLSAEVESAWAAIEARRRAGGP
jgi:dephospho-CoA kinase